MGEARGDTVDRNWLHASSVRMCGKMAALERLLQLWHESGGNKVGTTLSCHCPPLFPFQCASISVPAPITCTRWECFV